MAGGQERELRRRIKSVESTKKITHAMELIAASRIVKAQQAIAAARPYVAKMAEVVEHLADSSDAARHPLFRQEGTARDSRAGSDGRDGFDAPDGHGVIAGGEVTPAANKVGIILITADRGLAGGYNSSIIRTVERMVREHRSAGRDFTLVPVGRKGESFFRYRNQPILWSLTGVSDRPSYEDARQVVAAIMGPFEAGELDRIELVYTRFISLGSQRVTARQLIPLVRDHDAAKDQPEADHLQAGQSQTNLKTDYEFEPEPAEILDRLLPSWLEAEVLAAMLESAASEHAARQRAMKAATENADELIKNLRRVMNRARQDAITTEIMEIVSGAEALRQAGIEPGTGYYSEIYEASA